MKVVIIGGNAAGMSAASRLVRKGGGLQVVVAERGGEVSYGACGLPYYVGGVIEDKNLMRIRTADEFRRQGVDLRLFCTAVDFNPIGKTVTLCDMNGKSTRKESYDKLIIATGSSPVVPPVEGLDTPGVYTLKTLDDGDALKDRLADPSVQNAVIVGGGYIGVELAEACLSRGKSVRMFEALPQILNGFDPEFGEAAAGALRRHGAKLYTGEKLLGITGGGTVRGVRSESGDYPADIVVFAAGVRPETGFIPEGALQKLPNGAIVTDGSMATSCPDVYAAGDCATVWHKILKKPVYIPLGTNANKQGRIVADVILGKKARFANALGTAMLRCLDLELAKTGVTVQEAKEAGINAGTVTVNANSHAVYYPDPVPVTIKLCYETGTKVLLGAQVMGKCESAWRIDVLACAVDRGMTAMELGQLDLGYAPPFSSVWDAIQIAANAVK